MASTPRKYWHDPADRAAGRKPDGWRVQYVTTDGRDTTRRFKTEREAAAFKAKVEHETATGTRMHDRARRLVVGDLADEWIAAHKARVEPSTHHPIPGTWRIHVKPTWGKRRIRSIRKSEVQRWVTDLRQTRSRSTAACALSILAGILQTAHEDRLLAENPARGIKVGKKPPAKEVWLDHAQIECLASEASRGDLVRVMAYTALRWSEAIDLRVKNVDLTTREVRVRQTAVQVKAVITSKGYGKSSAAWRTVAYPKALHPIMVAACQGKIGNALLFPNGKGEHLRRPDSRDGWFAAAVKRCQKSDPEFPHLTPHGLRHVGISHWLAAGIRPEVAMRMAGHETLDMTLRLYNAIPGRATRDAADLLDASISEERGS